jgi:hypothetical protein
MDIVELATTSISSVDVIEEPFELGQDGDLMVPERLLADWVEMLLLTAMIVIGAPLNILTLIRLLNALRRGKVSIKTNVSIFIELKRLRLMDFPHIFVSK